MRSPAVALFVLAQCVAGPGRAEAVEGVPQIAFSTLGSDGTYVYNRAHRISGASASPSGYEAYANQFVAWQGGTLSGIELGVGYSSWGSPDSQVDVRLTLDTGVLPLSGPTLVQGTITTSTLFGQGGLTSFIPESSVQIVSGESYWLVLTPHSDTTASVWCNSSTDVLGGIASTSDVGNGVEWFRAPGSNYNLKAFEVTVIPEPTAFALLGLGSLTLVMARRRE